MGCKIYLFVNNKIEQLKQSKKDRKLFKKLINTDIICDDTHEVIEINGEIFAFGNFTQLLEKYIELKRQVKKYEKILNLQDKKVRKSKVENND
jgi:5-bromo-4-chloroindolyl phosphate hydrolysis protein